MERGSRWLPILRGELSRSPRCSKSAEIQAANQTPAGYPACAGCALQVAAVMMEPGAQAVGVHGPIVDADAAFLRRAQRLCSDNGAVLIFDEIITGFRYRAGSVQHATGVVPDLTCLGKALSGGMALSALLGSKAILGTTLSRAHYYPTFRGEVYSLAAAKAALGVYGQTDVPGEVERIGRKLFDGIDGASRAAAPDAAAAGVTAARGADVSKLYVAFCGARGGGVGGGDCRLRRGVTAG